MGRKSARKGNRGEGAAGRGGEVRQPAVAAGGGGGWKWYVLLAAVMAVTLVSYANSVTNDFVFDDIQLIAEHPLKGGVGKIPQLLGMEGGWGSAYRPVRMISYAIDYSLNEWIWGKVWGGGRKEAGLTPAGYHIGNGVYHLVTVLLVFLVTRRLAGSMGVGLLAAGLFALHPVHTDSVTYLSGRRDILFTLFYLLGFYYFLRYRETGKWQWLAGTCAAYGLSLGSKEMGVTLPLICLSYDVVKGYRRDDAVRGRARVRTGADGGGAGGAGGVVVVLRRNFCGCMRLRILQGICEVAVVSEDVLRGQCADDVFDHGEGGGALSAVAGVSDPAECGLLI